MKTIFDAVMLACFLGMLATSYIPSNAEAIDIVDIYRNTCLVGVWLMISIFRKTS